MWSLSRLVRRDFSAAGRWLAVNAARCIVAAGVAGFGATSIGCYEYTGKSLNTVTPDATVSADITDVGRVALKDPVGSEVANIEGKAVGVSDTAITVMVSRVRFLNGLENEWQGQALRLANQDIKAVSQRTFSKSRTAVAVALGAAAVVVMATTSFFGVLSGTNDPGKGGGGQPDSILSH